MVTFYLSIYWLLHSPQDKVILFDTIDEPNISLSITMTCPIPFAAFKVSDCAQSFTIAAVQWLSYTVFEDRSMVTSLPFKKNNFEHVRSWKRHSTCSSWVSVQSIDEMKYPNTVTLESAPFGDYQMIILQVWSSFNPNSYISYLWTLLVCNLPWLLQYSLTLVSIIRQDPASPHR